MSRFREEDERMTLTEFLLARLAEVEQTAKDATWHEDAGAGEWTAFHREGAGRYHKEDGRWFIIDALDDRVTEIDAEASDDAGVARHIALHDPARVLADVEAKRRIVSLHGKDGPYCLMCTTMDNYPCTTLRILALPYASHADYDESWRPAPI